MSWKERMYDVSHFFFLQINTAVAASQLSPSEGLNISDCPITFYGRTFTFVEVSKVEQIFKNTLQYKYNTNIVLLQCRAFYLVFLSL